MTFASGNLSTYRKEHLISRDRDDEEEPPIETLSLPLPANALVWTTIAVGRGGTTLLANPSACE